MSLSLTGFSWWSWSGGGRGSRRKEKKEVVVSNGSSSSSAKSNLASTRKVKKKWHSREERRSEKQLCAGCGGDVVLVASDGGGVCLSGSESDGPEWSIGWMEAHGPGFVSTRNDHGGVGGGDDGFAVLVPCYRPGCEKLVGGSNTQILSAIKNLPNEFTSGNAFVLVLRHANLADHAANLCDQAAKELYGVAFFSTEFLKP